MKTAPPQRRSKRVLYIASSLPSRSETFVYREVLELRRRRWDIRTASVRAPELGLGEQVLDDLGCTSIPIYGTGLPRVLADSMIEAAVHPVRAVGTFLTCLLDALQADDVPLTRLPKTLCQCVAAVALSRRLRPHGIDHIHAHMAHVPATMAMYASRQLRIGFSFTGHAVDLFRDRSLLRAKLRSAVFIASISRWHREFYQTLLDGRPARLPIVRCGVDVESFKPSAQLRLPLPGGTPTILAAGRLVPKKGFDLLLRALAEIKRTGREMRCIIIGDGPERARLIRMSDTLDLQDAVTFEGAQSNDRIRCAMQNADVFVLPCRVDSEGDRDGIPVVLMEAMASGLPVISGDLPTIRELIDNTHTGLLVNPERIDELASAIRRVLNNARFAEGMAREARRHVAAEFSSGVNAARLEREFETVLGHAFVMQSAETATETVRLPIAGRTATE